MRELPPTITRPSVAGRPLHGPNLFPARPPALRGAVLDWMATMTELGHRLLGAVAVGLGLDESWFSRHVTADPTVLFRIFHYPPAPEPYGRAGAHRLRVVDDPRPGRHARAGSARTRAVGSRYRRTPTYSSSTSATCSIG